MNADDRIAELVLLHGLPPSARDRLGALLALLEIDEGAPTTVTAPHRAVDIHVADSLSALEVPGLGTSREIADIGSGAGLPGLVLAIALPDARVALVESLERRCAFLERACAVTGVTNARVVHSRAEAWAAGTGKHDLVTARAVGSLALLCEYAAPLLAHEGKLLAWKGHVDQVERLAGEHAARELGLEVGPVIRVRAYPGASEHHLHMYVKTSETPSRFPRRAGIARKRPLGTAR